MAAERCSLRFDVVGLNMPALTSELRLLAPPGSGSDQLLQTILRGQSNSGIRFADLRALLLRPRSTYQWTCATPVIRPQQERGFLGS